MNKAGRTSSTHFTGSLGVWVGSTSQAAEEAGGFVFAAAAAAAQFGGVTVAVGPDPSGSVASVVIRILGSSAWIRRRNKAGLNVSTPQTANDPRSLWAQIYVSFQTRSVRMRITEEVLDAMFSRIGYVQDCVVKHYELDVSPHRQTGYGFVYFTHQEDALRAIRHFKQQTVDGVYFDCNACFAAAPPTATVTAPQPQPPQPAAAHVPLPPAVNVSLGGRDDGHDAEADEESSRKAQEASPCGEPSPTAAAEAAHRVAAASQRSPHASQAHPHSSGYAHYAASSHQQPPPQSYAGHPPALTIVSSRSASTAASPHNFSSHSAHSGSSSAASSPFAGSGPPAGRPPALAISSHRSFHGRSPAPSPYPLPLPPGHYLQHSLPAPAAAPHGLLPYGYAQQPSPTAHAYGAQFHGGHPQQLMAQLPLAALPLHSLPVPAQAYYYPVVQPHGHAHATSAAPLMVSAAGVPPPYALPGGDYAPHYQRFGESKSSAMAPPFDFYAANAPPMAAPSSMYVAQSYAAYEQPAGPPPGFVYYAAHAAAGHHGGDSCGPDAPPGDHPAARY
eukprot:gene9874-7072_t